MSSNCQRKLIWSSDPGISHRQLVQMPSITRNNDDAVRELPLYDGEESDGKGGKLRAAGVSFRFIGVDRLIATIMGAGATAAAAT